VGAVLRALQYNRPVNPAQLMQQAGAHAQAGRHAEAAACFEELASLMPGDPGVWCNLGMLRAACSDLDGAADAFRNAIDIKPDYTDALACLGILLATRQAAGEAEMALKRAADLAPNRSDVVYAYTRLLTESGRASEAVAILRRAIARNPRDLLLHDKLCMMLNYIAGEGGASPEEIFRAHQEFGRLAPPARPLPRGIDRSPDRRLRVGYLSPDLREHSVAYFLEPLLEHRDPATVETFCYHVGSSNDTVTARLRSRSDHWHDLFGAPDETLYQRISTDKIDILFDLAGHTAGNKLSVMALRPAPVQASYIGYPNTTGLPQMTARFVDEPTDPQGAESLATERLIRLSPCFLCYRPSAEAPPVTEPPSLRTPHSALRTLTFGSFNSLAKLSPTTIALWSRLLHELPGSRLMLKGKGLADPAVGSRFLERFASHGIAKDRLDLVSQMTSTPEHLGAYSRVDIALDPFPYNGTTTTCEALWMGVPVISLVGRTHAARVGLSLLSAIGLPEFAAPTPEAYLETAKRVAADPSRLSSLRTELRPRMAASPLCNAKAFVPRFESELRRLWRAWTQSPS
jgi:protein O-GlcNAc transferase